MTNLKKVRESKGLTQAELAEKSGVNLRTVQNYEQGFKDINRGAVVTVLKLSEALDCNIKEILNDSKGGK